MGSSRQRLEWKMGNTVDANDGMHTSWGGARVCEVNEEGGGKSEKGS